MVTTSRGSQGEGGLVQVVRGQQEHGQVIIQPARRQHSLIQAIPPGVRRVHLTHRAGGVAPVRQIRKQVRLLHGLQAIRRKPGPPGGRPRGPLIPQPGDLPIVLLGRRIHLVTVPALVIPARVLDDQLLDLPKHVHLAQQAAQQLVHLSLHLVLATPPVAGLGPAIRLL